ncbi:MAG: aminotransferase class I/II-fold pyridoxal phosphate-dependent enzyme, partial [Candidatus Competibacteraceae bacterium]|nr:aminotransferase class I/II-fold pyridoxal phosphate-dependent enzyme [Candidatus Competibacteraceae bacterium]
GLVVIDEAYAPFTDASFLPQLGQFDNLLVMRTLSKMGLAGLRLGYLLGAPQWLQEIDKLRLPYNINTLTQISAEFALRHQDILQQQAQELRLQRDALARRLTAVSGMAVYPSEANFLLLRLPAGEADKVHHALLEQGILIKNLHSADGVLHDCLRITIGTPEQNELLYQGLRAALD